LCDSYHVNCTVLGAETYIELTIFFVNFTLGILDAFLTINSKFFVSSFRRVVTMIAPSSCIDQITT